MTVSLQPLDPKPHVLGWHDSHCASVALLSRDGRILYAAAEERFTKRKLQKGFPANTFGLSSQKVTDVTP